VGGCVAALPDVDYTSRPLRSSFRMAPSVTNPCFLFLESKAFDPRPDRRLVNTLARQEF